MKTEDLDALDTRATISNFVCGAIEKAPSAVHLNRHLIDVGAFSRETWDKMQMMLGRCDFRRLAQDDVYGIEYFSRWYVQWSNYEITKLLDADAPEHDKKCEIASKLERARAVVLESYRSLEALQAIPELHNGARPTATIMTSGEIDRLAAAAVRVDEMDTTLEAERLSAAARVAEMEATLEAERPSVATRVAEMEATREAELSVGSDARSRDGNQPRRGASGGCRGVCRYPNYPKHR